MTVSQKNPAPANAIVSPLRSRNSMNMAAISRAFIVRNP